MSLTVEADVAWAETFASFDSIDRARALEELSRCIPLEMAGCIRV